MLLKSYNTRKISITVSLVFLFFLSFIKINALPVDFYVSNSVLANGKWAKIEISETGMQFLSNTTLRTLGFNDPSKVNIYGYGGRMISEDLNQEMIDDLPLIPSIQTTQGIIFFGFGNVGWKRVANASTYSHIANPYSEHAYYFISDVADIRKQAEIAEGLSSKSSASISSFTERLVHEQDLLAPSNTGRLMLGEDFRSQNSKNFNFSLTDNIGDAIITVAFGAKSTGASSIMLTANGDRLPASNSDRLSACSSTRFIATTKTVKTVENPGNSLNLGIQFSGSGTVSTAALDYIEVEYERNLRMVNGELYFYLSPQQDSEIKLSGADSSTIVWDVTDPKNIYQLPVNITGENLSFISGAGYHEYVAFSPASVKRNVTSAGKISNQDLHSMEAPGMLIICPEQYKNAAVRLSDLHAKTDGLTTLILTPEEIYNEFSCGNPDVSAFRKLLKMWYDRAEGKLGSYPGYCLIMSRPTYDNKLVTAVVKNAGYPRVPIWQSPTGDTESSSYSTDDFIGMLSDNLSALNIGKAEIHVAVGRMPVKSVSEAENAITKLENYLLNPTLGSWRNNVMIIADDQDNGVHLSQAETCYEELRKNGNGSSFLYEKLYLDAYPLVYTGTGPTYPAAKQRMLDKFKEGVLYIDYIGHANPAAWSHEALLNWTDITSMTNTNLPFIYAATCEFLRWDDDEVSGAEEMWLNPNAGVIGMICPSRSVLISANGVLNKATSAFVFQKDEEGKSLRVGDIMVKGKNAGATDSNKLRYGLIGDPSMRLPSPEYSVVVDKINNINLSEADVSPEIKARSSMSAQGYIADEKGNIAVDFNGILEIQLYDAEKVITTYGNGDEGVESIYNDRKTRLYSGRVKVENGVWSTNILMPSEIENNYSPALLSCYAYSDSGKEANGANEEFFVYGFESKETEDDEGPEILAFYLNGPSFENGDAVSPSPLLKARFRDESGINLSEAGIGHSMILSLDSKIYFDDITAYYAPDTEDPCSGELTYPLSDISAGEHTLSLTVWDNESNSTTVSLSFVVSASWLPEIETLTTDVNPATTSVNFIVGTDGISGSTRCKVEVFDLLGRKLWSSASTELTSGNNLFLNWNLQDSGGSRVPRGIYIYKATVTTGNGAIVTKSKKLAVGS